MFVLSLHRYSARKSNEDPLIVGPVVQGSHQEIWINYYQNTILNPHPLSKFKRWHFWGEGMRRSYAKSSKAKMYTYGYSPRLSLHPFVRAYVTRIRIMEFRIARRRRLVTDHLRQMDTTKKADSRNHTQANVSTIEDGRHSECKRCTLHILLATFLTDAMSSAPTLTIRRR